MCSRGIADRSPRARPFTVLDATDTTTCGQKKPKATGFWLPKTLRDCTAHTPRKAECMPGPRQRLPPRTPAPAQLRRPPAGAAGANAREGLSAARGRGRPARDGSSSCSAKPCARRQLPRTIEATQERMLFPVSCTPRLDGFVMAAMPGLTISLPRKRPCS